MRIVTQCPGCKSILVRDNKDNKLKWMAINCLEQSVLVIIPTSLPLLLAIGEIEIVNKFCFVCAEYKVLNSN